ncbi:hypothetical protein CP369_10720 [Lactobacillus sp. UMNPBX18]|nr:hypothetical protein CP369_10720 [Lactobacillus sp. UMNPBX18]
MYVEDSAKIIIQANMQQGDMQRQIPVSGDLVNGMILEEIHVKFRKLNIDLKLLLIKMGRLVA